MINLPITLGVSALGSILAMVGYDQARKRWPDKVPSDKPAPALPPADKSAVKTSGFSRRLPAARVAPPVGDAEDVATAIEDVTDAIPLFGKPAAELARVTERAIKGKPLRKPAKPAQNPNATPQAPACVTVTKEQNMKVAGFDIGASDQPPAHPPRDYYDINNGKKTINDALYARYKSRVKRWQWQMKLWNLKHKMGAKIDKLQKLKTNNAKQIKTLQQRLQQSANAVERAQLQGQINALKAQNAQATQAQQGTAVQAQQLPPSAAAMPWEQSYDPSQPYYQTPDDGSTPPQPVYVAPAPVITPFAQPLDPSFYDPSFYADPGIDVTAYDPATLDPSFYADPDLFGGGGDFMAGAEDDLGDADDYASGEDDLGDADDYASGEDDLGDVDFAGCGGGCGGACPACQGE